MAVSKQQQEEPSFSNLRDAVRVLYYAAHWTPDRPVDSAEIWTAVRDAAGFPKGSSPVALPFPGIRAEYDVNRLRLIGKLVRNANGNPEFTSEQVNAFLLLHGEELIARLDTTVREFLEEKL